MDETDFGFDQDLEKRSEAAANWIVAHGDDETLMRRLANDPTMGEDPALETHGVLGDADWLRIAREVEPLRSLALSRLKGYAMVANRAEVVALTHAAGTPQAYAALIRMLRALGDEVCDELADSLVEPLLRRSPTAVEWRCIVRLREPDRAEVLLRLLEVEDAGGERALGLIDALREDAHPRLDFAELDGHATSPNQRANLRAVKSGLGGLRWPGMSEGT